MIGCCDRDDYESVFTRRFARRVAKRYDKSGLNPTATRIVDFVVHQGITDASVLEIGGGVGNLQIELLRRGAAKVTNLEISKTYEAEAGRLLEQTGMSDRVKRRFVDIAVSPDDVEPADVVVLHRVVCCYPDYNRLLTAAATHAKHLLVYSHPADNAATRFAFWSENMLQRLRRNSFRAFIHNRTAMIAAAEATGMAATYRHHSWDWDVVGLIRNGADADDA